MNRFYVLIFSLFCFFSTNSFGKVTINKLDFSKKVHQGKMLIKFQGNLKDYPELKVNKNSIYVIIPDSQVVKTINKRVPFATNQLDTKLQVAQYSSNATRVKVIFPFDVNKRKEKVSLTLRDNHIELSFPKLRAQAAYLGSKKVKKVAQKKKSNTKVKGDTKVVKDVLNEDYLNSLIDQQKTKGAEAQQVSKKGSDSVKTTQASGAKPFSSKGNPSFSLVEYGGKFVAFLGVVLLLFYGVITLMKKGFIKKGKLGFLNKTEQVSVLSQTHIAPKKSLMLIRAHNQVFLVSNTDSGIHPISEIKDVPGLLKEGELKIAGDNFDTNLGSANNNETSDQKIKLKEDIMQSNKQSSLSDFIDVKEKVKFSDSIKKKVKSLKPLQ